MSRSSRSISAVAVALSSVCAAGVAVAPAHAATAGPVYREYVALGDSWSADVLTTIPPTTDSVPIDCAQSASNYPHQIAEMLHVPVFRDATCGSATTVHMAHPQTGLPLGGTAAPQFNKLTPTTDLVTLGIGGNDIGLAADIEACLSLLPFDLPGQGCKAKFTAGGVDQISNAIKATAPKIRAVIAGIHQRSPHARILLVNYLDGVPVNGAGCWPVVPIPDVDMAYMAAKFQEMNAMLATVSRATHTQLVDTFTPTVGHDVCKAPTVRDIEGLIPLSTQNALLVAFPFHPNQSGANAQTQAVYAAIRTR